MLQQQREPWALGRGRVIQRLHRAMQKLVGQPARQLLEHLLFRHSARERPARTLELVDSKPFVMALQRLDRRRQSLVGVAFQGRHMHSR